MNRNRSEGSIVAQSYPGSYEKYNTYTSCGNPASWTTVTQSTWTSYDYVGTRRTMSDVVVPGFHERRKRGEVFFNPMSRFEQTVQPTMGSGMLRYLHNAVMCSGQPTAHQMEFSQGPNTHIDRLQAFVPVGASNVVFVPTLFTGSELESMCVEASTRCLNDRGRAEGNLYETIAELGKTRAMLPSLFNNLNNLVGQLARTPYKSGPRSRVRSILGAAREAGNAYLLARYGVKPLVQDISNVMQSLNALEGRFRVTARGRTSDTRLSSSTATVSASSYEAKIVTNHSQELKVRAMSLDEFIVDKLWAAGFGYKGLVTLPWELVPYSFVVDWFVNVGEVIGALVPTPNLVQLGTALTYEYSTVSTCFIASYQPKGIAVIQQTPSGSKVMTTHSKCRIPNLMQPRLVLRTRNPFTRGGGSSDLNFTRIADATALSVQRLVKG